MIGDRVKELREGLGLTQAEISTDPAFGVKQGTLAAYERNAREPGIDTIKRLAEYFGVTTDYLLETSKHTTPELAVTGYIIPLSDNAITFLKEGPPELVELIDTILASSEATTFLEDMRAYIKAASISPDELPAFLLPLADRLSRKPTASADAVSAFVSWEWKVLCEGLAALCADIGTLFDPSGQQRMGRPKKAVRKNQETFKIYTPKRAPQSTGGEDNGNR